MTAYWRFDLCSVKKIAVYGIYGIVDASLKYTKMHGRFSCSIMIVERLRDDKYEGRAIFVHRGKYLVKSEKHRDNRKFVE